MWKRLALIAFLSTGTKANTNDIAKKDLNKKIAAKPKGISKLLRKAESISGNSRELDNAYYSGGGNGSISKYSIQFQGCHHIQQWNADADDEDVRLQTKRLARFRLVPYEKCDVVSPWANAKVIRDASNIFGKVDYGEYIVDLNTFVAYYLEAKEEENQNLCADYQSTCQSSCGDDAYQGDDDAYTGCMTSCYKNYGCSQKYYDDDAFKVYDYTACAEFDWASDDDAGNDVQYYFGPYCADQGGEIRMNLFTDDTCTTLATCGNNGSTKGATCYTKETGYILPGTKESVIEDPCLPCTENYLTLEESINSISEEETFDFDNFDFGYSRDVCTNLYAISGKCEKHMKNGQYNNACKYLEGIQVGVSSEGYAVAVRKSLAADISMITMCWLCAFLGFYITYMKTLLNKPISEMR
mmetsp:Transcript_898/g.966  ORF Transcript_898/g.966 Transcript_898/m.966 type:complete len:412 (+) Transcript_898:79-1314(+)